MKIKKSGGRGVLVGNFILTAAHCITYHTDGRMILGDYYLERVLTHTGPIDASPVVVEAVADVAVLGCPDCQNFYQETKLFEKFCSLTKPVRLARGKIEPYKPFPVSVFNADGSWLAGTAETFQGSNLLAVETTKQILPGASGGPILNSKNELVAVVSSSPTGTPRIGFHPLLIEALPTWILAKILSV